MTRQPLAALCLFLGLSLAGLGCGEKLSLPQETLDRARASVQTALDSWKAGDPPTKVAALSPPIIVTDPDWNAKVGARLLSYEIKKVDGVRGQHVRCTATLSIQSKQGKQVDREVVYEVQVGDKILIGRDPIY